MAYTGMGQANRAFLINLRLNKSSSEMRKGFAMRKLQQKTYDDKELGTRGQSYFHNVQFSWMYSEQYGLCVAHMRCGICLLPLESRALRIGESIYLVCEEGHLVGTDTDPEQVERDWMQINQQYENEVRDKKKHHAEDYARMRKELAKGQKTEAEIRAWENTVPSYGLMPQYASRHEYNQKLVELVKEFEVAFFTGKARTNGA
jgi:hypothetical protein